MPDAKIKIHDGIEVQDLYLKNVPRRIREVFKASCTEQGQPMERAVMSLLIYYVLNPDLVKVYSRKEMVRLSASWNRVPSEPYPDDPIKTPVRTLMDILRMKGTNVGGKAARDIISGLKKKGKDK